tara:strand:+ start:200 stop:496 length:297 start_codon:yes stop_codon:yes gene_type:complete
MNNRQYVYELHVTRKRLPWRLGAGSIETPDKMEIVGLYLDERRAMEVAYNIKEQISLQAIDLAITIKGAIRGNGRPILNDLTSAVRDWKYKIVEKRVE